MPQRYHMIPVHALCKTTKLFLCRLEAYCNTSFFHHYLSNTARCRRMKLVPLRSAIRPPLLRSPRTIRSIYSSGSLQTSFYVLIPLAQLHLCLRFVSEVAATRTHMRRIAIALLQLQYPYCSLSPMLRVCSLCNEKKLPVLGERSFHE